MEPFETVYEEHFGGVYRYVLSLCGDEALAEEVTQEAFFRAMERLDSFRGDCRMFVWLCQIARNTYFSLRKKRRRYAPLSERPAEEAGPGPDVETALVNREEAQRLHRLLHELPEPYKEVFTLRVFGELPFARIGGLFGKTDSWARLVFYRAKNELRRRLDDEDSL